MEIIKKSKLMTSISDLLKSKGEKIGLVPTMGYLHKGHISIIEKAKAECSKVFISIFVNPMQFGPKEDFQRYPRNFKRDCSFSEKAGADYIFFPSTDEMYKKDFKTFVEVQDLGDMMCGRARPGHFRGVCTVVLKLFNIIRPDVAYFGQKDYQQLVIIRKMTEDLNIPVDIAECPTVREEDGLAISSRNKYLSSDERKNAIILFQSLKLAEELIIKGQKNLEIVRKAALEKLENNPLVSKVDYFDFRDKDTLCEIERIDKKKAKILIASAIWIGRTRLIDNILLESNF
ncbi:MAG: pantoate--beta-alanine ligase [Actinobacteria bacterium]|nr:pantoate--beta-alanine ligase [Actinomycetota bacterium]